MNQGSTTETQSADYQGSAVTQLGSKYQPGLAGVRSTVDPALQELAESIQGELSDAQALRMAYATDASSYREYPRAICWPASTEDLRKLLDFARQEQIGLIPRTAGTSLAGQVVGSGIVVDISRHFNRILESAPDHSWVRVQPGVIRDDLNRFLAPHGRYFGPETSTASRAMIGGMVGNNSCGSNSVVYGSTREHVIELEVLLADGTLTTFGPTGQQDFAGKLNQAGFESKLYRHIDALLASEENREVIDSNFPKKSITRRNTGYALDMLMHCERYQPGNPEAFNFSKLLCGSEGTLGLITSIKLSTVPTPPPFQALVCAHFNSIDESLKANLVALQHEPSAVELMDYYVLERTKDSPSQIANRFFLEGEPAAVLVVDIRRDSTEALESSCESLVAALKESGFGYAFPIVRGAETSRVWSLRKAGLGLLSNVPGDAKPVPVIEDTAVDVNDLPAYISDFNRILSRYNMSAVHYAHAGSGELHLRPVIDLKKAEGHRQFRLIAEEVAGLVKEYEGSLSGEHGDGRLRGEFLEQMVGRQCYQWMKELKRVWDPEGLFNPGKIVDTPAMDSQLRFEPEEQTAEFQTGFRWDRSLGFQRAVEQCNGAGECRKSAAAGGTMCPSYQATGDELHNTRARANILREVMSGKAPGLSGVGNFDHPALDQAMDLCLSCKGCTGECPSNVDMARMKSEWQYQKYRKHGIPWRTRLFGHANKLNSLASRFAPLANFFLAGPAAPLTRSVMGVAPQRNIPKVSGKPLHRRSWESGSGSRGSVVLFLDAFTNLLDVEVGQAAIELLIGLGYRVDIQSPAESGRTYLSKGMLEQAKAVANVNVRALNGLTNGTVPLLGIEPSAILTFVDEYPDLVDKDLESRARELASRTMLISDFLATEVERGKISAADFDQTERRILLHGHCHQKALGSVSGMASMLGLPAGHAVQVIPSGCCGMAGSFGYEKAHYDVSMAIGELVLFPTVRQAEAGITIAAPGTSCRHQILDGTGRQALHPLQILRQALKS